MKLRRTLMILARYEESWKETVYIYSFFFGRSSGVKNVAVEGRGETNSTFPHH